MNSEWERFVGFNKEENADQTFTFEPDTIIDFKEIYPNGTGTEQIIVYPNLNGNGCIWKNLYIPYNKPLYFKGTLSNLIIDNLFTWDTNNLIKYDKTIDHINVTCRAVTDTNSHYIMLQYGGDSFTAQTIDTCTFNLWLTATSAIFNLHNSDNFEVTLKDCNLNLNISSVIANFSRLYMGGCLFTGKIEFSSYLRIALTGSHSSSLPTVWNVWNIASTGTPIQYMEYGAGGATNIYNTDLMEFTVSHNEFRGVTAVQMATLNTVYPHMFETGSPWVMDTTSNLPKNTNNIPVTSLGAFNKANTLPSITLPANCVYHSNTFNSATTVTGGHIESY